jgi:hypothetical protein
MTDDVFAEDQTATQGQESNSSNDVVADLLSQIVNAEGVQKYSTIEEALKGTVNGQQHITKLEEENRKYREEIDKRMSAEQVLAELKAKEKPDEKPSTEFSPEALQELVDKRLEARTESEKAKANEDLVQSAMRKEFGEKSNEIVSAKAKGLGLTPEALRELSQASPQAVLTMFGLASTKQESVPTRLNSGVNTEAQPVVSERSYQWYRKLRRDDYTQYMKLYPQMMADAEKQGDDFYK